MEPVIYLVKKAADCLDKSGFLSMLHWFEVTV